MIERANPTRFWFKARQPIRIAANCCRKTLQRDLTAQPCVAGAIHFAHAAGAKRRENLVRADTSAGRKGHAEFSGELDALIVGCRPVTGKRKWRPRGRPRLPQGMPADQRAP